ncbi:MAG: RHS repeat-associated core domain-containing protein [Hyphomonadaceae bacterium]
MLHRFLQTDPVGYADDLNLYAYVGGDPLNASDSTGACRLCRSVFNVVRRTIRNRGDVVRSIRQEAAEMAQDVGTLVSPDSSLLDRAVAAVNIVSPVSADEIAAGANAVRGAVRPRPGRLGGPEHRAGVDRVAEDIQSRGLEPVREARVRTPEGRRESRYVDVAARDPVTGETVERHQVGRQTTGGQPVAREREALGDIEGATGQRPEFHPYNE